MYYLSWHATIFILFFEVKLTIYKWIEVLVSFLIWGFLVSYFFVFTLLQALGSPQWLQPTYNLETHLSQLIGDYYLRKREGQDNLWILKPWNMARTIDTTVTDNLPAIIRLMETGPKICQKYIEKPALFQGKKFDLRYIVLVRSMHPLEIFLSDCFWVYWFFFWALPVT